MDPELRLARSYDGMTIHREDCRHGRIPWLWARQRPAEHVRDVAVRFGYRFCRLCKPFAGEQ